MGYYQVAPGQRIESQHMNLALEQGTLRFDDATDRDNQIPAPLPGQTSYLADTDTYYRWTGTEWLPRGSQAATDSWAMETQSFSETGPMKSNGGDLTTWQPLLNANEGNAPYQISHTVTHKSLYQVTTSARMVHKEGGMTLALLATYSGVSVFSPDQEQLDGSLMPHRYELRWQTPSGVNNPNSITLNTTNLLVIDAGTLVMDLLYLWNGADNQANIDYLSFTGYHLGAVEW